MQRSSVLNGGDLQRLVVGNATGLVALVDADGTVLYVSAGHEQKLGYAPAALIGGTLAALSHPGDLERLGVALAECVSDGRSQLAEFRIGAEWTSVVVFTYLVLIMVFRPQGLIGEETRNAG